jgi:hypothetical protein
MPIFTFTSLIDGQVLAAADLNTPLTNAANATVPVANGGTGITAGTSGGVLAYTATGTIASSGLLAASRAMLGGGAGAAPTVMSDPGADRIVFWDDSESATTYLSLAGLAISGTTLAPDPTRSTQDVATSETTTSTSYTDLATSGPAVTITPGRATDQIIVVSARSQNSGADQSLMSPAIAGAAAQDVDAASIGSTVFLGTARPTLAASVASGSTHTAKYKVGGGTGTWDRRRLAAFTLS